MRTHLNIIPQDPYFLAGSVRLNADPLGESSDEEILAALKKVELWGVILEKVREETNKKGGEESVKGSIRSMRERERKAGLGLDIEKLFLSCGQKQVFCLARAMLRKSMVLVLDEATSRYDFPFTPPYTLLFIPGIHYANFNLSVDNKTDSLMQSLLRSSFHKQTIIAVAHRLDTILDFDRVAVLEGGELAEVGAPYDLLATEGSRFRSLYFSGVREEDLDEVGDGNL